MAEGIAQPEDVVATYRGETPCVYAKAGAAAKWEARESAAQGLHLARYVPMTEETRARFRGAESKASIPEEVTSLSGSPGLSSIE